MSQKIAKPTLTGQRIKTRKRDEKEKYDPAGFRDSVFLGLKEAGNDLEAVSKFLDVSGSKLDYRRYAETLFDVLLAGGILAPGGSIQTDPDPNKESSTDVCVFTTEDELEALRGFAQVFNRLIRRYKYLEKFFEDEMKKVLVFLKGFTESQRHKLAKITALLLANGQVTARILNSLFQEHLVKNEIALDFVLELFEIWMKEKDVSHITNALCKAQLQNELKEFFPVSKRSQEYFEKMFIDRGLESLVQFQKAQDETGVKQKFFTNISIMVSDNTNVTEVVSSAKKQMEKNNLLERDVLVMCWKVVMNSVEWNKKEELVAEQALKHLKQYTPLFAAFSRFERSETSLINNVQEYCYDNMNFMKVFGKIIILFYKTNVLGEDTIMKWYKESHQSRGKSVFIEQMKTLIEWLQSAEEESDSSDED